MVGFWNSVGPCETDHAKHRQAATVNDQSVGIARVSGTSILRQSAEVACNRKEAEVIRAIVPVQNTEANADGIANRMAKYSKH